jgi:predicted RNA polymerase sigma factor
MPAPSHQAAALRSVLHVLYLIFNEGYTASAGRQLQRTDLAAEAIRLTRLLHAKAGPAANPELSGLLALVLLTDARRDARTGPAGEVIPLDEQDRTRWDRSLIAEGVELLTTVLKQGSVGPYQLQAAVAAVHDEAPSASETDWPQIVAFYDLLMRMSDNPVVRLNHAVAVSMVQGPQSGLALLEELEKEDRLRQHHRFYAVRAHLKEKVGQNERAAEDYEAAAVKTASLPERKYLLAQAARVRRPKPAPVSSST